MNCEKFRELEFPVEIEIEDSLASIVKKLLKKKVSERLCNLEAIKHEKIFENFNFVKFLYHLKTFFKYIGIPKPKIN